MSNGNLLKINKVSQRVIDNVKFKQWTKSKWVIAKEAFLTSLLSTLRSCGRGWVILRRIRWFLVRYSRRISIISRRRITAWLETGTSRKASRWWRGCERAVRTRLWSSRAGIIWSRRRGPETWRLVMTCTECSFRINCPNTTSHKYKSRATRAWWSWA